MYFIGNRKKLIANNFVLHLLPTGAVLFTMLGLSLLAWNNSKGALATERKVVSSNIAKDSDKLIHEQLTSYEIVLTAAAGLFTSSNDVTRAEWRNFIEGFELDEKYPGIQGVGFAQYLKQSEIPSFEAKLKTEGLADNKVFPDSGRNELVVNYLFHPTSEAGIGFDSMSDASRREAIIYAMNSGNPALTSRVEFVHKQDQRVDTGLVMFVPVYADNNQLRLPAEERQLVGFVFAPINVEHFFEKQLSRSNSVPKDSFQLKIYDTQAGSNNLLYESPRPDTLDPHEVNTERIEIKVAGRVWYAQFDFTPATVSKTSRERPLNTLIAGLIMSPVLAAFVLTLLIARTRALSQAQQSEVNEAKDELLSLASHQLRTPATSVKQYIGMLKEGFAGDLTAQQKNLLTRAYDSNERQLHIINELLYVAKLDANGLVLTPRRFDLNKLIRTQAQDLGATAKKSDQKIRVYLPKKPVFIEADEHCIAMAVENLISNALKYSYEASTTTVRLISKKSSVEISVTDHGVGIEPENIALLFQRFSRIPNTFSQKISGSGIGLYLSQQLVNLHGGSITVDSIKDKGTTFTIHLPKKYVR